MIVPDVLVEGTVLQMIRVYSKTMYGGSKRLLLPHAEEFESATLLIRSSSRARLGLVPACAVEAKYGHLRGSLCRGPTPTSTAVSERFRPFGSQSGPHDARIRRKLAPVFAEL
jgi:hypothetical protein